MVIGKPPFFDEDKDIMMTKVIENKLDLPKNLNNNLKDILSKLLEKNIEQRIGFNGGFSEIKGHPWLREVDWIKIFDKKISMN